MARTFAGTSTLLTATIPELDRPFTFGLSALPNSSIAALDIVMYLYDSGETNRARIAASTSDFSHWSHEINDSGGFSYGESAALTQDVYVRAMMQCNTASPYASLWIDGANRDDITTERACDNIVGVTIGGRPATTRRWSGPIAWAWIMSGTVDDDQVAAWGKGFDPRLWSRGKLLHFWPIWGDASPETDIVGGAHATITGTPAKAAQPPIILPTNPIIGIPTAAAGAFEIDAQPGSVQATGILAGVLADRVIDAQPGSVELTGVLSGLIATRVLDAQPGQIDVTGTLAGLVADRNINAEPGSAEFTGVLAGVVHDYPLNAEPGSVAATGTAAGLLAARVLDAQPGAAALTGFQAELQYNEPDFLNWSGSIAKAKNPGLTSKVPSKRRTHG